MQEKAAAPKDVLVLDALPLTDVGKPYKVALRADATERAATDALAGVDAKATAVVADGGVVVRVQTTDPEAVGLALSPYAFTWELRP